MSCKKIFILFLFLFSFSLFTPKTFAVTTEKSGLELAADGQEAMMPGKIGAERWLSISADSIVMKTFLTINGEKYPLRDLIEGIKKLFTGESKTLPKVQISGVLGQSTQMISALFVPQASGVEYIASVTEGLLGKPAYAQGFGFKGLEFLLPLWKLTRNIVYVLSSIMFVVIGLMIILRVKVSPQAVVTVQSAIPQVITTLILVTFSYAIAGLMIDIGNFIAGLVFVMLFQAQGQQLNQNILPTITSPSTIPWIGNLGNQLSNWINNVIAALPGNLALYKFTNLVNPTMEVATMLAMRAKPDSFSMFLLSAQISTIVTSVLAAPLLGTLGGPAIGTTILGGVGGLIGAILMPIIISIMILIWMMKLFFGLIKVYVTIIFKIIVGPLEIAMGAFPNSKAGFSSWVLDVFANVMVFPIVMIFLVVLNILTDKIGQSTGPWVPGMLSTAYFTSAMISACVGLAGLALISKLPEMIPQYIFMIKPSPWGQAIGQTFGEVQKSPLVQAPIAYGKSRAGWAAEAKAQAGLPGNAWDSVGDALATFGWYKRPGRTSGQQGGNSGGPPAP